MNDSLLDDHSFVFIEIQDMSSVWTSRDARISGVKLSRDQVNMYHSTLPSSLASIHPTRYLLFKFCTKLSGLVGVSFESVKLA
jgi:hypothetical protein